MHYDRRCLRMSLIAVFCLLNIGFGLYAHAAPLAFSGVAGLCCVALLTMKRGEAA
jgi:hypothetical protein